MIGVNGAVRDLRFDVPARGGARHLIVALPEFDFARGEMTVLAGRSGSGKSTLLYLISGLLVPTTGTVSWAGDVVSAKSERARDAWRRHNAGFVFQNFHLVEEMSPIDNVVMTAWFTRFSARGQRAAAIALLDRFGVPAGRERTALLSRGEQQRVAIARALLPDPRVIFADEPTASLDAPTGEQIAQMLQDMAHRDGRTVVVASHDPAVIERGDRVLRVDATAAPEAARSGAYAS